MDEIDKMVQELIEYLSPLSDTKEALMIRAINVATIQLDYANYEVGVVDKKLRHRLIVSDAEVEFAREQLKARKRYARKLGMALDRIVGMAGEIG